MIYPVILCGGSGTRLWPLSRKSYPKQFTELVPGGTLLQATARRLSGAGYAAPCVLTGAEFRFIVTQQLTEAGVDPGAILIEPEGRNTAPAILAAALHLAKQDPEAVMLVAPSDHVIPDASAFRAAVARGLGAVSAGDLVTFGITPDRAETGYGYLELAGPARDGSPGKLRGFIEKPEHARAAEMLAAGTYLWNSGIFLFSVRDIVAAFAAHAPALMDPVARAVDGATADLGFLRLAPEAWRDADDISIDYAIMEKATNISAVPYPGHWSDLGGWDSVWRAQEPDEAGVVTHGPATAMDCRDTLLRSEDPEVALVGLGLEKVIAVATSDGVLVAGMDCAQDVKSVVARLKEKGVSQAEQFPKQHRPWGWFQSLAKGGRFQVKRIVVEPGATLSLQSHYHRSEHWIVVEGSARATIGEDRSLVTENESVYVPAGTRHRLENPGKVPLVLIEVQTGSYLGEDDILRYEDVYARP